MKHVRCVCLMILLRVFSFYAKLNIQVEDVTEAYSIVQQISQHGFPQCQQVVYTQSGWSAVAEMVMAYTTLPLILIDRQISLDDISKVTIVKKPLQDEWCVGWMLFINDLDDLSYILRMIRWDIMRWFTLHWYNLSLASRWGLPGLAVLIWNMLYFSTLTFMPQILPAYLFSPPFITLLSSTSWKTMGSRKYIMHIHLTSRDRLSLMSVSSIPRCLWNKRTLSTQICSM